VSIAMARNGEVEIAYETFGAPSGEPLLLVMGLGVQMLYWPDDFCAALADRGFAVARFDNRDSGLSTRFSTAGVPSLFTMLTSPAGAAVYRLADMAMSVWACSTRWGGTARTWSACHWAG
jgi:pimeloyl-ACP methyl ester carboxylesterase